MEVSTVLFADSAFLLGTAELWSTKKVLRFLLDTLYTVYQLRYMTRTFYYSNF